MLARQLPLTLAILLAATGVAPASAGLADHSLADYFSASGFVAVGATAGRDAVGWLEGGPGAVGLGGDGIGEGDATHLSGRAHLVLDWEPDPRFGARLYTAAQAYPGDPGDVLGIVEAYLRASLPLGAARLQLKAGHFFLPTTHEAVEVGWSSPYTLTTSAITAWIGEEVKPTGVLAEVVVPAGAPGDELRIGGSAFEGNDTSGALLAWRGWALHDRLGVYGEWVPLPANMGFADNGPFRRQSDRGTQPFGDDLDGRVGWSGHARWTRLGRASLSYARYDNRGDRRLYGGQYAWDTRFDVFGLDVSSAEGRFTLAAEDLDGETTMGFRGTPWVEATFHATYALVSWRPSPLRFTLRWDRFDVDDEDGLEYDDNTQEGDAWTFAAFWEPRPAWRFALELLDVDATRPQAPGGTDVGARTVRLEARYYFGL